jgi:hypothetical protein
MAYFKGKDSTRLRPSLILTIRREKHSVQRPPSAFTIPGILDLDNHWYDPNLLPTPYLVLIETLQIVSDDLIASDADGEPPSSYTRDLINVCTLTTDLGAVPKSLFTRLTTTRGVEFDNLDFTLEMVVESAGLAFELKVDGFRYGRVEAEFH